MKVFKARAVRATHPVSGRDIATRSLFMLPVLAISLWLLAGQIKGLDPSLVFEAIKNIPNSAILIALIASALSLWAVAAYDRQAFRALRMPNAHSTLRSGFAATATSQTLGFGLVIGTLVRWRCYKAQGITLAQAAALTGIVSVGFIGCLAMLLGVSTLFAAQEIFGYRISPFLVLSIALIVTLLSAFQFGIKIADRHIALPTLPVFGRFMSLTAFDTSTAALALWILLPAEMRPDFALFMQVFLISLGLGLISSAPGGVGVFEVTFLMLLPDVPQAELLSAILVFRGLYYGIPFLLGAALLLETERTRTDADSPVVEPRDLTAVPDHLVAQSTQAEAALAYLGDKAFLRSSCERAALMFGRSGSSLVALGRPIGAMQSAPDLLMQLVQKAKNEAARPSIWRATPQMKDAACALGWHARLQGHEAIVTPQDFAPSGKKFRELKRKLKQAEAAGVVVDHSLPGKANLKELAPVAAIWKARHQGCELGFSQGQFKPAFLARHDILTARLNGDVIAFITVWCSGDGREMSLDLMRSLDDVPQGTMHLLVREAIAMAKARGAVRFSLCAVQLQGLEGQSGLLERLGHWIYTKQNHRHHLQGLERFKNAFRPNWEPRYFVTKSARLPVVSLWNIHQLLRT